MKQNGCRSEVQGTEHRRGRNSLMWEGLRESELSGFTADKEIDKGVGMDRGDDREMGSVTNEGKKVNLSTSMEACLR